MLLIPGNLHDNDTVFISYNDNDNGFAAYLTDQERQRIASKYSESLAQRYLSSLLLG